jgi:hypothetical protein
MPTFVCNFSDGEQTRMTVHCGEGREVVSGDIKLDMPRGVKLARYAYESRKGKTAFLNEIARCFGAVPRDQIILRHKGTATMAYEHKDNSGSVFVNDQKTEENHPDRSGSAVISGKPYWVNGWLKKTKDGKPPFPCPSRRNSGRATAARGSRLRKTSTTRCLSDEDDRASPRARSEYILAQ